METPDKQQQTPKPDEKTQKARMLAMAFHQMMQEEQAQDKDGTPDKQQQTLKPDEKTQKARMLAMAFRQMMQEIEEQQSPEDEDTSENNV